MKKLLGLFILSTLILFTNPAESLAADPVIVPGNLITNPSFESGVTGWTQSAYLPNPGDNDAVLATTSDAHSGTVAANVSIANYVAGDAKWLSNSVSVSAGQYYTLKFWYKSTPSVAEVNVAYNGTDYVWLGNLPTVADWTEYTTSFLIPSGVTSIEVAAILDSTGSLTVDDYSLVLGAAPVFIQGMVSLTFDDGWKSIYTNGIPALNARGLKSTQYIYTGAVSGGYPDYMAPADIIAMRNTGHEIAAHTRDHVSVSATSTPILDYQINGSRTDLLGFLATTSPLVTTFAYPYGEYDTAAKSFLASNGFAGARSVDTGYNFTDSDKYALKIQHVTNATTLAEIKSWVDTATSSKTWLILMWHRIEVEGASCLDISDLADEECTTQAILTAVADYLSTSFTPVVTVTQGIDVMGGAVLDTVSPTVVLSTTASSTTNLATIPVSVAWSEPVNDFSSSTGDIVISGGTISNFIGSGAVYSFSIIPTADGPITVNIPAGAAKDPYNNPSVASLQLSLTSDRTKPAITLLGSSTVDMTTADAYTDAGATSSDNLSGDLTSSIVVTGLPIISTVPGAHLIKYNVKDAALNAANEVVRTVNISDLSAPIFSNVPADMIVEATGSSTIVNYTLPTATDDVDGSVTPVCTPVSGSGFGMGTTLVSCNAHDNAGNIGLDSFTVTVQDTTAPTITAPATQNFESEEAVNTLTLVHATATDAVDASPVITYDPHDFGFGTTTVIWTAADDSGNESTTTSQVYVKQIIPEPDPAVNSSGSSSGRGGGGGGGGLSSTRKGPAPINHTGVGTTTGQVLGASTYNFTETLSLGSTGNDVTELQKKLAGEGLYSGPITSYFGPMTEAAVKAYQTKYGIDSVGVVGPKTRAKLNVGVVSLGTGQGITAGMTIDQMKALLAKLQAQLAALMEQVAKNAAPATTTPATISQSH